MSFGCNVATAPRWGKTITTNSARWAEPGFRLDELKTSKVHSEIEFICCDCLGVTTLTHRQQMTPRMMFVIFVWCHLLGVCLVTMVDRHIFMKPLEFWYEFSHQLIASPVLLPGITIYCQDLSHPVFCWPSLTWDPWNITMDHGHLNWLNHLEKSASPTSHFSSQNNNMWKNTVRPSS